MSARNTDIDALMDHLRTHIDDLDRSPVDNRRACWTLICRARKKTDEPVEAIKKLIDTVFSGHPSMAFYAKNLTSFRYLVNNASKIANEIRSARASSPAEKNRKGHDIIRGMYGGSGA